MRLVLAKSTSDQRKPDGLFVIQPHEVQAFLLPLTVGSIPRVGKVTESGMKAVGIPAGVRRPIHMMRLISELQNMLTPEQSVDPV